MNAADEIRGAMRRSAAQCAGDKSRKSIASKN